MMIDPDRVAERLEAIRLALGLTGKDFAHSFGCDPSSYSKIIRGEKPLKADMGYAIAERWGVPMDYLYRGRLTDLPESLAKALRNNETQRKP